MLRRLWPSGFWGKLALFFAAGILLMTAALFAVAVGARREIEAHRAWLVEKGFPGDAHDAVPSLDNIQNNAAVHYQTAVKLARQIQSKFERALRFALEDIPYGEDPGGNPARLAAYHTEAVLSPKLDAVLDAALGTAPYHATITDASNPYALALGVIGTYREIARVETIRSRAEVASGDADAAVRRALRLHRLGRKCGAGEPLSETLGVSFEIRANALSELNVALRHGAVSAASRREIESQLNLDEEILREWSRAVAGDMACFAERVEFWTAAQRRTSIAPLANLDTAFGMSVLREAVELSQSPHAELIGASKEWNLSLMGYRARLYS
ncbi:MAG TPA: hypothetical protein VNC50_19325, partial [Planctomycetia bacterium]|nr:hypothetical protein [Planctomycetia bacterium]